MFNLLRTNCRCLFLYENMAMKAKTIDSVIKIKNKGSFNEYSALPEASFTSGNQINNALIKSTTKII